MTTPLKGAARTNEIMRISHYVERTTVLGPCERSVVWFYGCNAACPGCIAETTSKKTVTDISPDDLADILLAVNGTEGMTISGGEPFLQAAMITRMLKKIKRARDYGVIVYTGFLSENLEEKGVVDPDIKDLLGLTDILIDGPYIRELDDEKPYRGSSNQRIIRMTDRYDGIFEDYYYGGQMRKTEIKVSRDGMTLVGVPSKAGFEAWTALRNAKGVWTNI